MQHALVAHALWEEEKRRARAATKAKLRTHPGGLDDLEEVTDEDESRSSSPGSPRSSLVAGAGEAGEAELHIYDPTNSRTPPHLPGDHSPNRLPPSPTRPPPPPSSPSRRGRIQETELQRREKDSISPPPRLPPRTHEEEEGVGFVAGHETCIGRYSQPCRSGGESCYDTKWFRAVVVLALLVSVTRVFFPFFLPSLSSFFCKHCAYRERCTHPSIWFAFITGLHSSEQWVASVGQRKEKKWKK